MKAGGVADGKFMGGEGWTEPDLSNAAGANTSSEGDPVGGGAGVPPTVTEPPG